ncbi:MAG: helix-turn-helix transcriptional regulator [Roseitalea sp.]|jgi:AraC-like DNA-binding protein|nr:helix-turn-helix transcriptional regulator [Roseitalea sp.]MBO6722303.1 helix-turn-helix transcriptional regulator [Roseitalea sp.]MBO6742367.1 helix-turn-helix transcriptional regulator [Roseitalea sp.]
MAARQMFNGRRLAAGLENCLVIPHDLHTFDDAHLVMQAGQAAIFHKLLKTGHLGLEFYNDLPCLCFVMRGTETFLAPDGREIIIRAGEMILLSRRTFMVSDFTANAGPLEAFLFFFDGPTIAGFRRQGFARASDRPATAGAYKIGAQDSLTAFMQALHGVYRGLPDNGPLLRIKLTELLHLIAALDRPARLAAFLDENIAGSGRRNIRHLLREHDASKLTVAQFARLSGRSVSAFNREFKRQFGQPPSQWLAADRLERARQAVLETETSVTEIGLDAGYRSTSHFIAQFKRRFGTTPKQLRLKNDWRSPVGAAR